MYDMYKDNNCGFSSRPDFDDRKDQVCDIESVCCDGFVKEEFTIRSTATATPVVVYESSNPAITRATIKAKNLSQNTSVNVTAHNGAGVSFNLNIAPNQEAAFTIDQLRDVTITTASGGPAATARVLLCFDLQVASISGD